MAAASRPAEPRDAILGVQPRAVYAPASAAEAAEAMAQAAGEKQRLAVVGGRTAIELGRAPSGLDAIVRTERLSRILEYAPSDMVLVAEAGVTLALIQETARQHQQRLALDPPLPERATVGGLVATGAFGPRRAMFGTIRDLIIGVALVRADGVLAHGGGKVVKNVAGFDLPKIACGSLGTLGMIATAAFRLHPLPESAATVLFLGLTAAQVTAVTLRIRAAQLEPTSSAALRIASGAYDLGVRFEGFKKGVDQQITRLLDLSRAEKVPCEALAEGASAGFWRRHDEVRAGRGLQLRLAAQPAHLAAIDALVAPIEGALHPSGFAWYPMLGAGFVSGEVADAASVNAALSAARDALVQREGSLVIEAAPAEVRAAIDPWGPTPPSFPLMQRLKSLFDPERRLNPGRFLGGL